MNKNLLIVDDDLPFRHRLSKSMEKKGFIVESFSDCKTTTKRIAEKNNKFDEKFIKLSREVYKTNDERAKIKLKINEILGSNIKEVKSHY